jgi:cytochrome c-type biogenesis protein CcmH
MTRRTTKRWRGLVLGLCLAMPLQLAAQAEPLVFESDEQQARFKHLTHELRCLVCQNQNLADSDAPLAIDLRNELYKMLQTGASDEQIKTFMVERYGDFVLYRPPLQGNTFLLWLGPALLLAGGAVFIGYQINRRKSLLDLEEDEQEPSNA